jgi:hypothetical protein
MALAAVQLLVLVALSWVLLPVYLPLFDTKQAGQ